jgi:leucine-rich repeat protein SHOC2
LKLLKLESISLNNNQLSELPNFFHCEKLSKIDISHNMIEVIEESVVNGLDVLQMLDLSHNRLADIPEGVMTLPKLRELNLASNKLKTLAEGLIAVWPSLLKIDLSDNEFA